VVQIACPRYLNMPTFAKHYHNMASKRVPQFTLKFVHGLPQALQ
jgi:hypothetical protein